MTNLSITQRRNESVTILDLKGNIRIGEGSIELKQMVRDLVEKGETNILLNLADVGYMDSSGLGELVAGFVKLQRIGGSLKLLHLTKRINELMVITKLLTVFDVYEDEAEAVKSFSAPAAQTTSAGVAA